MFQWIISEVYKVLWWYLVALTQCIIKAIRLFSRDIVSNEMCTYVMVRRFVLLKIFVVLLKLNTSSKCFLVCLIGVE